MKKIYYRSYYIYTSVIGIEPYYYAVIFKICTIVPLLQLYSNIYSYIYSIYLKVYVSKCLILYHFCNRYNISPCLISIDAYIRNLAGIPSVPWTRSLKRAFSNIGTKNAKKFLFLRNLNENFRSSNYEKKIFFNNNIF